MGDEVVYIRFRNRFYLKPNEIIYLDQIAQIAAPIQYEARLKQLFIHQITKEDKHLVVIDIMQIIKLIKEEIPGMEIRNIGKPEIIIEIKNPSFFKRPKIISIAFVWVLLFIGSGLAIMNFHHDVSMLEVHRRIYYLITGKHVTKPLMLQIPYSLGIGAGMILFFNHLFKKKFNEEPSPLEVEMFLYQQSLDQYVVLNENKENRKRL